MLEAAEQAGCEADIVGCWGVQERVVVPVRVAVGVDDCTCNWQLENCAAGGQRPLVDVEENGLDPRTSSFKNWR